MKKKVRSEIFELLSSFSKQEMKKFGEFLNSPFHNKSRKLIRIYSFIRQFHPEFCNEKLTLEYLHDCWQHSVEFHPPTVRNDLSDLYKLGLRFLSVESYFSRQQNLLSNIFNELNKRNLPNLFDKFLKSNESVINGKFGWNNDLYLERFRVNSQKFNRFDVTANKSGEAKRGSVEIELLDAVFSDLSSYFISQLVPAFAVLTINRLGHGTNIGNSKIHRFFEHLSIDDLSKISQDSSPLLMLKLSCYNAFKNFSSEPLFKKYVSDFKRYMSELDAETLYEHYFSLISYCSLKRMQNIKYDRFDKHLISIYDIMLKNKIYRYKFYRNIPITEFRNMIIISVETGSLDWTKTLITEHLSELEADYRDSAYFLGNALISFRLKKYGESLNYLNKINSNFNFFKFDVYNNRLKIFFESKEYESVLDLIKSYTKTIKKSMWLNFLRRIRTENFVKAIKILSEMRNDNNFEPNKLRDLSRIIKNANDSLWLSQKLNELIKEKGFK